MRHKVGTFVGSVSGGVVTLQNPVLDLPSTHLLDSLYFRVTVNVDNDDVITVKEDGLARFFRFRIYGDGADPMVNLRGDNLRHYLTVHHRMVDTYTEVPLAAGVGAGTWDFEFPFADRRLKTDPALTRFDLALAENPRIEMDFGQGSSISSDADIAITSVTVAVEAELTHRPVNFPGPDRLGRYLPLRRLREFTNSTLNSDDTDQQVRLPFGRIVRQYLVIARSRATDPERSDALVTRVEVSPNLVRPGGRTWRDLSSETQTALPFARPTGVVLMDFDKSATLNGTSMLNLVGARDHVMFVDTDTLSDGLDFVTVEESIDYPQRANVAAALAFLGRKG